MHHELPFHENTLVEKEVLKHWIHWDKYLFYPTRQHLPLNITIEQIEQKLDDYFLFDRLQTPQQIQNTIRHICDLVR
jgi:hypothetical protein